MADDLDGVEPVVILGAARSGTNILRDVLSASPAITTWPCDEINYIWRHGNARVPHDELTAEHARPRVVRYVRGAFVRQAAAGGASVVLEKTCASTLRVGFVDTVLPEARYVVIERDPVDAVASAMLRWTAPMEAGYIAAKLRFVPLTDLPLYATRYAAHRLGRLRSDDDRLSSWGPRFAGIDEVVASSPLHVVCAVQWARSVARCRAGLAAVDPSRIRWVRYEDLAADAPGEVTDLTRWLLGASDDAAIGAASAVSAASVGRGRSTLSAEQVADIEAVVAAELPD